MQKYEYQIQTVGFSEELGFETDEAALNLYGKEGWELVTVLGPAKTAVHGVALIYFFRRPI